MDPFTLALLGLAAGAGPIGEAIGGFAGEGEASEKDAEAQAYLNQALAQIQNLDPATRDELLQSLQVFGGSELGRVDPQYLQAQNTALAQMQQVAAQGGMTPQSRARLMEIQSATNQQEQAQRGAIQQQQAARGLTTSGGNLAAQLLSQQGQAQRSAMAGTQVAGDAERRALDAMMRSGQFAQDIRGQEFQRAQAEDAIKKFNAQMRGQAYDTSFDQQARRAQLMTGALSAQQQAAQAEAERRRRRARGVGRGIGEVIGGVAGAFGGKV